MADWRPFFRQARIGAVLQEKSNHRQVVSPRRRRDRPVMRSIFVVRQCRIAGGRLRNVIEIANHGGNVNVVCRTSREQGAGNYAGVESRTTSSSPSTNNRTPNIGSNRVRGGA